MPRFTVDRPWIETNVLPVGEESLQVRFSVERVNQQSIDLKLPEMPPRWPRAQELLDTSATTAARRNEYIRVQVDEVEGLLNRVSELEGLGWTSVSHNNFGNGTELNQAMSQSVALDIYIQGQLAALGYQSHAVQTNLGFPEQSPTAKAAVKMLADAFGSATYEEVQTVLGPDGAAYQGHPFTLIEAVHEQPHAANAFLSGEHNRDIRELVVDGSKIGESLRSDSSTLLANALTYNDHGRGLALTEEILFEIADEHYRPSTAQLNVTVAKGFEQHIDGILTNYRGSDALSYGNQLVAGLEKLYTHDKLVSTTSMECINESGVKVINRAFANWTVNILADPASTHRDFYEAGVGLGLLKSVMQEAWQDGRMYTDSADFAHHIRRGIETMARYALGVGGPVGQAAIALNGFLEDESAVANEAIQAAYEAEEKSNSAFWTLTHDLYTLALIRDGTYDPLSSGQLDAQAYPASRTARFDSGIKQTNELLGDG